MNMKQIIIDPRSSYSYGSFYVLGLEKLVGKSNISYNMKPFVKLSDLGNDLRFVVYNDKVKTNYFIHLNDPYHIDEENYNWCDVYGCVNANYEHYPKYQYPKLISLAPSFAIRKDKSILICMKDALYMFFLTFNYVLNKEEWNKYTQQVECSKWINIKRFFLRRIKTWTNRLPLSSYENTTSSKDDYVFFLSTLWYSNTWNKNDEGVNLRRAYFIRACQKILGNKFEGGLHGDSSLSSIELFSDILCHNRVSFSLWIEKTKQSALVFNTPAFWDCHGWKLGEYLALGKCIVSTQLSNDLPYPLEHGVNVHFVENSETAMKEAIEYILSHPDYRHKLEQGAREYWNKYGTPEASLRLLGIE